MASAAPLNYSILNAAPPDLSGSVADGQSEFNQTCASCHGLNAIGTDLAPPLLGELLLAQGAATLVAERVRTSGATRSDVYPGLTGGRMPFWSSERLSDQELADVIAFVLVNNPEPDLPYRDGEANTIAGLDQPGNCASTHEKVGYTLTLSEKAHGVSGMATIHNDCTIKLHSFNYDGNGIDVRVYGGVEGDYHNGFPMSPDLLRDGGYQDATLYIQIPAGKTLDDLDGISIWCVDAAVDFGSGIFGPP